MPSSSSSQRSRSALVNPPSPVRWRVWYLVDQPGWTVGWFVVLAGVWILVVGVTGRGYLGWLAVSVLVLASWRLWAPIRYELSPEGIQQAIWGFRWTIAWKAIGRYEPTDSGVWLFPNTSGPTGKQARGMFLPCAEHRQQVLGHLQYHVGPTPEKGKEA